jgi:ABC-2 type transport system ATP-binding protein
MIQVEELSKIFIIKKRKPGFMGSIRSLFGTENQEIKAVDNITFSLNDGDLVGYIGPNGAGKSTTIKMLTGILTPTGGTVRINGLDPIKDRKKNAFQIGVVFGQRTQLWWDLPVEESFDLIRSIYKIEQKKFDRKMEEFNELLGLKEFSKQQARKISLGQRMKADLAASLLHSPSVLFLDEPTIGLDILAKENVRQFIQTINQRDKVTIILTTHDVQDIEFLANRIIIIDKGKVGYDGNLNNFNKLLDIHPTVNVHLANPIKDLQLSGRFTILTKFSDQNYSISLTDDEPLSNLIEELQKNKAIIREINREKPDLEVAIKKMYTGKKEL